MGKKWCAGKFRWSRASTLKDWKNKNKVGIKRRKERKKERKSECECECVGGDVLRTKKAERYKVDEAAVWARHFKSERRDPETTGWGWGWGRWSRCCWRQQIRKKERERLTYSHIFQPTSQESKHCQKTSFYKKIRVCLSPARVFPSIFFKFFSDKRWKLRRIKRWRVNEEKCRIKKTWKKAKCGLERHRIRPDTGEGKVVETLKKKREERDWCQRRDLLETRIALE